MPKYILESDEAPVVITKQQVLDIINKYGNSKLDEASKELGLSISQLQNYVRVNFSKTVKFTLKTPMS